MKNVAIFAAISPQGRPHRHGIMLVETIVAAILLGAAMALVLPGLAAMKKQRLAQRFEVLAAVELKNVADSLRQTPVSELPELSRWFQMRYASASLEWEQLMDPKAALQEAGLLTTRLTIRRPGSKAHPDDVVSLVIWRPEPEEKR